MKIRLASSLLSILAVALAAQPTQAQGLPLHTYAAVTSDGFFVPDLGSSTPLVFAPPSAFGGATNLDHPAVEWLRGSDAFLVVTGANLYRVDIVNLTTGLYQVQDLTPSSAQPLDLYDLDLHPGTGELFLLDQSTDSVLRYSPPFTLGMSPTLALPIPGGSRVMSVDSRSWPLGVVTGDATQIARIGVDGSIVPMLSMPSASGVDQDPQYPMDLGTYGSRGGNGNILRSTSNPGLGVSLNYSGFCSPFALTPRDVEWSPIDQRVYTLAQDGINAGFGCIPGIASGPNHIVEFPLAQTGGIVPQVITNASLSGIRGTDGDLSLVQGDYGFVSPYGDGCTAGAPNLMTLDVGPTDVPLATGSTLDFQVSAAPVSTPIYLFLGYTQVDLLLPFGCHAYTSGEVMLFMGTTNAQGKVNLPVTSPALPIGTEVYGQATTLGIPGGSLSHGLRIHFGL